ncbi:hypothetical protein ATANTOWER_014121 [Ataeniobius toweri]|uniref:Uncharacterized protein n=1 Tax=Ataeniobius toweri TaxID=208326 RepID=A0ABU7C7H7_9TELE|nr:hypothetical protein [Ataeniobius toweri]
MCIQGFSIKICSSECEEPQTRPPGPGTDTEEIRDTYFTFLLKTIRFVSIVFHIIIARSTQPDNESKGKDKKLLFAYTRYRNCATTRTGSGRLAIWLFSPGALACLIHHPKSYTECIKQGYNMGDGSFQSSRGANQREGAWWLCLPRLTLNLRDGSEWANCKLAPITDSPSKT